MNITTLRPSRSDRLSGGPSTVGSVNPGALAPTSAGAVSSASIRSIPSGTFELLPPARVQQQRVPVVPVDLLRLLGRHPTRLRDGGFPVSPGDYPAFIEQIHRYVDLPAEDREHAKKHARDFVRREYTWEKTTEQYLAVFAGQS